jgi:hypothetical protein
MSNKSTLYIDHLTTIQYQRHIEKLIFEMVLMTNIIGKIDLTAIPGHVHDVKKKEKRFERINAYHEKNKISTEKIESKEEIKKEEDSFVGAADKEFKEESKPFLHQIIFNTSIQTSQNLVEKETLKLKSIVEGILKLVLEGFSGLVIVDMYAGSLGRVIRTYQMDKIKIEN